MLSFHGSFSPLVSVEDRNKRWMFSLVLFILLFNYLITIITFKNFKNYTKWQTIIFHYLIYGLIAIEGLILQGSIVI